MKPVRLAPMAGVSDKPFRQMVRLFGNQVLYTEMIGVESLARHHPTTLKMMSIQDEKNIIVQLVGIRPSALELGAKMAQDAGAIGVDINMGCPVKKLISNGSGSALLKTPKVAAQIVEKVKSITTLPVSAKMRIGWDENSINAVEVARVCEKAGASAITVHPRTRAQGYSGKANWDIIKEVVQAVNIPVIGNGDVTSPELAKKMLEETKCAGVMIGRGAIGNPWLIKNCVDYLENNCIECLNNDTYEKKYNKIFLFL